MLAAACLAALFAVAAPAQQPPPAAPSEAFVLLLRDPAGRPVDDAVVDLWLSAAGEPLALAWFAERALAGDASLQAALPIRRRLTLSSDARGAAKAAAPAGAGVAAGFAATPRGLGALVLGLQPGRAQRLDLQPLAALAAADAASPITVHTRVRTPHGSVTLGPFVGATVRLPAGDHEVWVRTRTGWQWLRLQLASGQTVVVDAVAPTRRVRRSARDWQLLPEGRPDVALFADDADDVALAGAAATAALTAWHAATGVLLPPRTASRADDDRPWPMPAAELVAVAGLAPPPAAPAGDALALVQRLPRGDWQPLACARRSAATAGADGAFALPAPPPGDCWLVHVRAGHAPLAVPYRTAAAEPVGGADRTLQVQVRDGDGAPVADVACEYTPAGGAAAATAAASDVLGRCRLGRVRAPGTLRVVDARFANQTVAVDAGDGDVPVVVDPGAVVQGRATWPDGAPARGVVVTLRDPRGDLAPAERTATADADGRFAFAGLAPAQGYVLFALAQRAGRTWSARAEVRGGEPAELVVRDEDPAPAPRR